MRAHRRSFVLLAATAVATTLAGCATSAADATGDTGTSETTSDQGASATTSGDDETSTSDSGTTDSGTSDDSTTDGTSGSGYADGTYTATGSYKSPGGQEEVTVTVTLADGVVTAVEVTPEASDPTSLTYQTRFASGVADQVVGKAIEDVDVSKVSGSSLTSTGFMAALEEIEADAQA